MKGARAISADEVRMSLEFLGIGSDHLLPGFDPSGDSLLAHAAADSGGVSGGAREGCSR
jgi:hypothetical protein